MDITYALEYTKAMGGSEEVLEWCRTTLAAAYRKGIAGDQTEIEHILDYLVSPSAPSRLRRMSYRQARDGADKWSLANQKKGRDIEDVDGVDIRTIHSFPEDGSRIVQLLTEKAYRREGHLMSHCVGGYSPETTTIYSYRDGSNQPHATFEVRRSRDETEVRRTETEVPGEITQVKGKGNGPIHPRYITPILAFLHTIGMEVRPHDMRNLGYYHLPEAVLDLISLFEFQTPPRKVTLLGHEYIYGN